MDNQRLHDLVRHQRGPLHDEGLITDAEYALLASDHATVKRLEDYDVQKLKHLRLRRENFDLRARIHVLEDGNERLMNEVLAARRQRDEARERLRGNSEIRRIAGIHRISQHLVIDAFSAWLTTFNIANLLDTANKET